MGDWCIKSKRYVACEDFGTATHSVGGDAYTVQAARTEFPISDQVAVWVASFKEWVKLA